MKLKAKRDYIFAPEPAFEWRAGTIAMATRARSARARARFWW